MITRRNFLKAGAAVAALSVVPNGFASILAKKEKAIGVQLYSVRDDLKTDFDGTMKALVDIGYKRMEAAGYRDGKFYGEIPGRDEEISGGSGCPYGRFPYRKRFAGGG